MATTTISGSGIRNRGGTVLNAGNVSSAYWDSLSVRNAALNATVTTCTPVSGVATGNIKAYGAGTFIYSDRDEFVIRGVSNKLSGVATSIIRIPASDYERRLINTFKSDTRWHITSWNYVTGAPTYGGSRGAAVYTKDVADTNLTNGEPAPTRAVPGELVYRTGAPLPVQDDYNAVV